MSLRKRGYQESETRSNSDGDTYYDVNLSDDVDQDEEPGKTKKVSCMVLYFLVINLIMNYQLQERRAFNSEYNDAIRVWLGENYKNKKGIEIEKSDILANYLEEAKKRGWILKNATTIGRLVGEVFGKLKTREVMRNKVKSYYYVDLALKNDDEEEIEDDDVVDHSKQLFYANFRFKISIESKTLKYVDFYMFRYMSWNKFYGPAWHQNICKREQQIVVQDVHWSAQ